MRLIAVLLSAAVVSMPVAVQAQDAVAETQPVKPPKPKKICRQAEASSTSRMGTGRVCKTEEEWAAAEARDDSGASGGRSVQSRSAD